MKFCPKCGAQLDDAATFCPQCGQPFAAPAQIVVDPADHTAEFDPKDISDNKVVAMLPYLMDAIGIIIALLCVNNSQYVAFHLKQSLKLMVCQFIVVLVGAIIPFLGWFIILPVGSIIILVLKIIGFFGVCSGKAKELPIIKGLRFLK